MNSWTKSTRQRVALLLSSCHLLLPCCSTLLSHTANIFSSLSLCPFFLSAADFCSVKTLSIFPPFSLSFFESLSSSWLCFILSLCSPLCKSSSARCHFLCFHFPRASHIHPVIFLLLWIFLCVFAALFLLTVYEATWTTSSGHSSLSGRKPHPSFWGLWLTHTHAHKLHGYACTHTHTRTICPPIHLSHSTQHFSPPYHQHSCQSLPTTLKTPYIIRFGHKWPENEKGKKHNPTLSRDKFLVCLVEYPGRAQFSFSPSNSLDSGVELCLEIDMSPECSPDFFFFLFYTSLHPPLYCLCCCFSLPSPCPLQPAPFFSPSLTFSSSFCRLPPPSSVGPHFTVCCSSPVSFIFSGSICTEIPVHHGFQMNCLTWIIVHSLGGRCTTSCTTSGRAL